MDPSDYSLLERSSEETSEERGRMEKRGQEKKRKENQYGKNKNREKG